MRSEQILGDQIIHVKRGRFNSFGWEPAWNSYFDFYASSKYISPPLIKLEDIAFHLFLRKNINDTNPRWRMPTFKQMTRKFATGQHRIEGMLERLDKAHLLKKESGKRAGASGENVANNYLLSDPIQTLDEFLIVASEGVFGTPLLPEWSMTPYSRNGYTPIADPATTPIAESARDQQTLNTNQTVESVENKLWDNVLKQLQAQTPADTFATFLSDTLYQGVEDGVAVITTSRSYAKDWLENRMSNQIKKVLAVELKMNGGEKISEVRFEIG